MMSDTGAGIVQESLSAEQVRRARPLLTRFAGTRRSMRFYPPDHPAVESNAAHLMSVVRQYHDEDVDVSLTFFEDELMLGEQVLPEDAVLFDQLIRDMTSIGAENVTFERGMTEGELRRAMQILAMDEAEVREAGGLAAITKQAALRNVNIGIVRMVDTTERDSDAEESAYETYTSALDLLREVERAMRAGERLLPVRTRGVVRGLVDQVMTNRHAILELSVLKDYDEYTFYHSVNSAILSLAVASRFTTDRRFLTGLAAGALMHDIGKTKIASEILSKPGPLTSDEWAEMRRHPLYGAEIAASLPGLDRAALVVIYEHHMRNDGSGYPSSPFSRPPHLTSSILSVADTFDAMTSRRSYSAAVPQDEAMMVLVKNRGTAFDSTLVDLFVQTIGIYPPQTVVRLNTQEIGLVVRPAEVDLASPVVRVVSLPDGSLTDPFDVDLSSEESSGGRRIVACLEAEGMNIDAQDYL